MESRSVHASNGRGHQAGTQRPGERTSSRRRRHPHEQRYEETDRSPELASTKKVPRVDHKPKPGTALDRGQHADHGHHP